MNDKLQTVLAELAEKLGTTVESLWPELVKYRVATALADFVVPLVVTIATGLAARAFYKRARWEEGPDNAPAVFAIITTGVALIHTVLTLSHMPALIGALVSPQAYTVFWLLRKVAGE